MRIMYIEDITHGSAFYLQVVKNNISHTPLGAAAASAHKLDIY